MNSKELIFNKALKLFALHGYDGTTVNMICRKIGISKSSFVNHFAGKDELLETILLRSKEMFHRENPTLEQRMHIADTHSLQETLNILTDQYITTWSNPINVELWQIVHKEQFRNNEVGRIILNETSTRIERLTATFDRLQKNNKMIACDSKYIATNYVYSIRAQHLDYVLSKLYLSDSRPYIENIYQTGKIIADLYKID